MEFENPGKNYVLIFDQFEELFTYPQEQIDELKKDLNEVLYLNTSTILRENLLLITRNKPGKLTWRTGWYAEFFREYQDTVFDTQW